MNNASLSVGTESQYSATSPNQFEAAEFKQEGGGIFSFLFDSEKGIYATELCLRAFNDKVPQISCYIIKDSLILENNISLDFTKQDKNGKTLLHFLVAYSAYFPDAKNLLQDVLAKTNAKNGINIQDSKGNTCVHYAMYLEIDDVVKVLASSGADLSIKNKEGLHIMLKTVDKEPAVSDIFIKVNNKINNNKNNSSVNSDIATRLDDIVKAFTNAQRKNNLESDVDTIGLITDTAPSVKISNSVSSNKDVDTEHVLSMIMKDFEIYNPSQQRGGAKKKTSKHGMSRASNNAKISGQRKMITYSEMSFGGASTTESDSMDESDFNNHNERLAEIARSINNKASEAHDNAILRIKSILKLEDDEARAVKAMLYDKIKKEKNELTNLDKAIELEKIASDEKFLKTIKKNDIVEWMNIIKKARQEKEQKKLEESSNTNDSSEKLNNKEKPKKEKKSRQQSRFMNYESESDDSSDSSDSEVKRSKKILELSDNSSTSSDSSDIIM